LSLFTVIPLIFLILGHAWEAAFVAICGDPVHFFELRTRLGIHFLSIVTVIPLILQILECAFGVASVAIHGDPVHFSDLRARLGSSFCRYLL